MREIKPNPRNLSSEQLGIAGEYFVAGELTKRGLIASITLRHSEGVDILCTTPDTKKSISIQVKTSRYNKPSWIMNQKSENKVSDNLFYIFVTVDVEANMNEYYVVPSRIVAEYISTSHRDWLSNTQKNGAPRKDTNLRNFSDKEKVYKDRWDLLFQ